MKSRNQGVEMRNEDEHLQQLARRVARLEEEMALCMRWIRMHAVLAAAAEEGA